MEKPLVSVITSLYNYENYISYCIESVRAQTYHDWEMIVVDDASPDNSYAVALKAAEGEPRIRVVQQPVNKGVSEARNRALDMAQGRFVAFLDADDAWTPEKLSKQVAFMLEKDAPISYTAYLLIDNHNIVSESKVDVVDCLDYKAYLKNTIIGNSTAMIDRSKTGSVYYSGLRSREDTQMWIRLLRAGYRAYGLPEYLTLYRTDHQSLTSNRAKAAWQVWLLYYKIEKLGLFNALYFFSFYAINAVRKRIKAPGYK